MFEPQNIDAGEPPLDPDLWLVSVNIRLSPESDWVERPDLYRSPANPNGLDPARWRAEEAVYEHFVLLDVHGATDYLVEGRCRYVVLEDLSVPKGWKGEFTLLRWEELPPEAAGRAGLGQSRTWGELKALYAEPPARLPPTKLAQGASSDNG
jgi:hypothetical protein